MGGAGRHRQRARSRPEPKRGRTVPLREGQPSCWCSGESSVDDTPTPAASRIGALPRRPAGASSVTTRRSLTAAASGCDAEGALTHNRPCELGATPAGARRMARACKPVTRGRGAGRPPHRVFGRGSVPRSRRQSTPRRWDRSTPHKRCACCTVSFSPGISRNSAWTRRSVSSMEA